MRGRYDRSAVPPVWRNLAAHPTCNREVRGSIPLAGSYRLVGRQTSKMQVPPLPTVNNGGLDGTNGTETVIAGRAGVGIPVAVGGGGGGVGLGVVTTGAFGGDVGAGGFGFATERTRGFGFSFGAGAGLGVGAAIKVGRGVTRTVATGNGGVDGIGTLVGEGVERAG
jgi:hypothetical protein